MQQFETITYAEQQLLTAMIRILCKIYGHICIVHLIKSECTYIGECSSIHSRVCLATVGKHPTGVQKCCTIGNNDISCVKTLLRHAYLLYIPLMALTSLIRHSQLQNATSCT